MTNYYRIEGSNSEGETWTMLKNGGAWTDHDEAVTYAMEYARSVSGTTEVEVERLDTTTIVTARGETYAERLRIDL